MAKLFFRYAVMNSGKSNALLGVNYNYTSQGKQTVLFSHCVDDRFGKNVIASRLGSSAPCISIDDSYNLFEIVKQKVDAGEEIACVLCDEVQFYSTQQINELSDIVDELDIPVICYGLRNTYQGELFEACKTLMARAHEIEGLRQVCHCGRLATETLKYNPVDMSVIREGHLVEVGAESMYLSVCSKHWKAGDLGHLLNKKG